jgi:ribosomal protein L14E/L6E/L27E
MKKAFITGLFWGLFAFFALSQDGVHTREGSFVKRIENNMYASQWNLDSKGNLEKLFFGDFNAWVEFFCSERSVTSFRIVKKGVSYFLEIKYVINIKEIEDIFKSKRGSNHEEIQKLYEERVKYYKVATQAIPISNQFAEKSHKRMFFCIDNFKATKMSPLNAILVITYYVTFRVVVDEAVVWSLKIFYPSENDAEKMANLCIKIATDVRSNKFYESKYIDELSTNKD